MIERDLNSTRTIVAHEICTKWDNSAVDTTDSHGIWRHLYTQVKKTTSDQIKNYFNLVWSTTAFGTNTPRYFKGFSAILADTTTLED